MNKEAIVLKNDRVGRVQTPVERQIALVLEYERSGLSRPRFAAMAGVKYQTFVSWRRKDGLSSSVRQQQRVRPVSFVEAVFSAGAGEAAGTRSTADLVLELSCGVKLHIQCSAHITLAVQLLNALQESRPC
ncbi:IS66 family insertion sequence element accessory protein TnpA [Prosthecobacter fusiformis]|nr:IS66 family insertion sequence element accessory protein TnpB [Prosthecobacter fusiformis]